MRNLILTLLATCSLLAGAATKVATQDWVKKYVDDVAQKSQVSVVTNSSDKSQTFTYKSGDGKEDAIVVSSNLSTNFVFTAVASTIDGVSEGTQWRLTGVFLNSTNDVLPQIQMRIWKEGNEITWRMWASNRVTSAVFSSMRDGGYWYLSNDTNSNERVKLIVRRVSDEEANRVFTANIDPPNSFNMLETIRSVIFPSVLADWLDQTPTDYNQYDVIDYIEDALSLEAFSLNKFTFKDLINGQAFYYEARFDKEIAGYDGSFKGDIYNINSKLALEDFASTQNWNIPFIRNPNNVNFDKLVFVELDNGDSVERTRVEIEKSAMWREFAQAMYDAYLERFDKLNKEHVCKPNINDNCFCEMWNSIHCPNGRGQFKERVAVPDEIVAKRAIPLHEYEMVGLCKVCKYNHNHDGAEHKRSGLYCLCDCGATVVAHTPRVGSCTCLCGASLIHRARTDAHCGCWCGEMDDSDDKSFHRHPESGEGKCWCYCRKPSQHKFVKSVLCPKVCGDCREVDEWARPVTLADHREKHESRNANYPDKTISSCGCECGRFKATDTVDDARFHYRKTGSCMCLGADGNGGEWHFPSPRHGCNNVCSEDHNGVLAKVAKPARGENSEKGVFNATISDHTKAGIVCGCACREFTKTRHNVPDSMHHNNANSCGCECGEQYPKHHYFSTGCTCHCENPSERMHRDTFMNECGICNLCDKKFDDPNGLNMKGHAAENEDHVPKDYACGCRCGHITNPGKNSNEAKFHRGTGTFTCRCSCGKIHKRYTNDDTGCNFCDICDWNEELTQIKSATPFAGHVAKGDGCRCICGNHTRGAPPDGKIHDFTQDTCICDCGKEVNHVGELEWKDVLRMELYCDICGRDVEKVVRRQRCSLCNRVTDEENWEEGHGYHPQGSGDQGSPLSPDEIQPKTTCACGCEEICFCTACREGQGGICENCGHPCGEPHTVIDHNNLNTGTGARPK